MTRAFLIASAGAATAVIVGWLLVSRIWGPESPASSTSTAPGATSSESTPGRRIRANLFFLSEDGTQLVSQEREVPFSNETAEQARYLLEEQLKAASDSLATAVPEGTFLRAVYVTDRGEAFVDLSSDVSTKHTGGSLDELLTVYTIVNALAVNLPSIASVQILVEGHEVDTLAGHIDLRQPLRKNLNVVSGSAGEGAQSFRSPERLLSMTLAEISP